MPEVALHAGPAVFEAAQETRQEVIDKFRLQQGLLLTVRPEQPISLSIDQLRRLSWEEHAGVWRDYVNALAQCLVSLLNHASPSMTSAAQASIAQLSMSGLSIALIALLHLMLPPMLLPRLACVTSWLHEIIHA